MAVAPLPVPAPPPSSRSRRSRAPVLRAFAAVAVTAAAIPALLLLPGDRVSVHRLSGEERGDLFLRTRENLTTVCTPGRHPELAGFCEDQARLAMRFPECDAACRTLARSILPGPTR